jgi:hypothetical protein
MTAEPPLVLFREVQRFKQPWLWIIIYGIAALSWVGFVQQIILGKPFGSNPAPDWMMWLLWLLTGIGLPWFFHSLRMTVVVQEGHISIRYVPVTSRQIPFEDIVCFEARTYEPVKEYGGWGIKGRSHKRVAYNVSGNEGVELELVGGQRVMIGSQRSQDLAAAIAANMVRGR